MRPSIAPHKPHKGRRYACGALACPYAQVRTYCLSYEFFKVRVTAIFAPDLYFHVKKLLPVRR